METSKKTMAQQQLRPLRASRKSQAMRIVRTIGQAFEVCHKLTSSATPNSDPKEESSDRSSEDNERRVTKNKDADMSEEKEAKTKSPHDDEKIAPPTELALKQSLLQSTRGTTISSPLGSPVMLGEGGEGGGQLPLSTHHQMQLLRQQLEQQQHQTQVAIAQVHLLKDQLSAETAARIEAQARAHQLLLHNKDLLDHVSQLVSRLQGLEVKVTGVAVTSDLLVHSPPQTVPALPDPTTPRSAPVYLPDMREPGGPGGDGYLRDSATYANTQAGMEADSPDSGHKEMSSDSLAFALANHHDTNGWAPTPSSSANHCGRQGSAGAGGGFVSPTRQQQGQSHYQQNHQQQQHVLGSPHHHHHQGLPGRNPFESSFNPTSSERRGGEGGVGVGGGGGGGDKVKIITPLPLQDASGNRLDLKMGGGGGRGNIASPTGNNNNSIHHNHHPHHNHHQHHHVNNTTTSANATITTNTTPTPRLDPPPRVHRLSRGADRSSERGSWYGGGGGGGGSLMSASVSSTSSADNNANFHQTGTAPPPPLSSPSSSAMAVSMTDSDYYSTYASSHSNGEVGGVVVYRGQGQGSGGGVAAASQGLRALMRYSDSSARSSLYSNDRDSMASLSALRHKLDLHVNDLNHNHHNHVQHHHQNQQQQQQASGSSGRWKMRISYTSDENSDNSDDMNLSSAHSPTKGSHSSQQPKVQLSALEEFDTLRA